MTEPLNIHHEKSAILATRFENLLRPIRDLTLNWNVDVVAALTEYMSKVGADLSITTSRENEILEIDFKEAALLVEGSTCVYTRKVDYLYTLVLAAADTIFEARGKSKPSQNLPDCREDESEPATADLADFLVLDDALDDTEELRTSITLAELGQVRIDERKRFVESTRMMPVPVHLLPPGPQIGRESAKGNFNSSGLRISEAIIHSETGALILDGIGLASEYNVTHLHTTENLGHDFETSGHNESRTPLYEGDADSDDDREQEFESSPTNNPCDAGSPDIVQKEYQGVSLSPGDRSDVLRQSLSDPYLLLNPHDGMEINSRPINKGKTWKEPASTDMTRTASRGGCRARFANCVPSYRILQECSIICMSRTNKFVSATCMQGQLRTRMRKFQVAKRARTQQVDIGRACNRTGSSANAPDILCDDSENEDTNEDIGPSHLYDSGGDEEGDFDISETRRNSTLEVNFVELPDELEEHASNAVAVSDDHFAEEVAASYEEACRKYLQDTCSLWQTHVADTFLEQRVCSWRSRIEPILDMEETRARFDIEEYGTTILERFRSMSHKTRTKDSYLSNLLEADESYEVCRKFLATLQLVNNYEVDVLQNFGEKPSFNPMLRLLSPDIESGRVKSARKRKIFARGTSDSSFSNKDSEQGSPARHANCKRRRRGKQALVETKTQSKNSDHLCT